MQRAVEIKCRALSSAHGAEAGLDGAAMSASERKTIATHAAGLTALATAIGVAV